MERIIVIGAGAAGLFAALTAARRGRNVLVLEKMPRAALKLGLTGKGRCNLTNLCEVPEFINNTPGNGKFLRPALYNFPPKAAVAFFNALGVETKVERGNRVFPVSEDAPLVARTLSLAARDSGAKMFLNAPVAEILLQEGRVRGVRLQDGEEHLADSVILATGGASYPATGSTGDGYRLAKECGHTVTELHPSLVPLETKEDWPRRAQGLSLKNVTLQAWSGKKSVYKELGEMLCTHFGVSGPLVLTASRHLIGAEDPRLTIDLKPGLTPEQLEARLLRDLEAGSRAQNGHHHGRDAPQVPHPHRPRTHRDTARHQRQRRHQTYAPPPRRNAEVPHAACDQAAADGRSGDHGRRGEYAGDQSGDDGEQAGGGIVFRGRSD